MAGKRTKADPAEAPAAAGTSVDGAAAADAGAAEDSGWRVRVRMFRQGLGDCFLLTFRDEERQPFHLMIDFGVILGTSDPEPRMKAVIADIARATGGSGDGATKGKIDVLVATHEHWDHVSGFVQAQKEFGDRVKVEEVWLAWTEDPGHALAGELRRERKKKVTHLRAAVARMAGMGAAPVGRKIQQLLDFFGDLGIGAGREPLALEGDLGARAGGSTADALQYVASLKDAKVVYRKPGEPVFEIPGGVRVYVLGPPEDRKLIKKSDPTKRGREVYEHHGSLSLADTFFAGLGAAEGGVGDMDDDARMDPDATERAFPFDAKYRILPSQAKEFRLEGPDGDDRHFFRERYGFDAEGGPAWRRIDEDWLGVATDLALALDGDTNNTSLALAFELGADGPVLLFPGDAQVGNWLSWDLLSWPKDRRRPQDGTVTAADLLRRTVLYKVGHHGSHNATLREKGLERMEHPALVALIPVDEASAKKKGWDEMPFDPLYRRLVEKTRGRVLRVDQGRMTRERARELGLAQNGLTDREWKEFEKRTPESAEQLAGGTPLWIDYEIHR